MDSSSTLINFLKNFLEKAPVIGILSLYIFYLGYQYYFFISDASSDHGLKLGALVNLQTANEKLKKRLAEVKNFVKVLEEKKEEVRELAIKLQDVKKNFSEQLDIPFFMQQVLSETKYVGLEVESMKPLDPIYEQYYIVQPFLIEFNAVFGQIITFLKRISQLDEIIRVEDFDIVPPDEIDSTNGEEMKLNIIMEIQTFSYRAAPDSGKANNAVQ